MESLHTKNNSDDLNFYNKNLKDENTFKSNNKIEIMINENADNLIMDSNEKKSISGVIENINMFIDSNETAKSNKGGELKNRNGSNKGKNSSKKSEKKRLIDLLDENKNIMDNVYTEENHTEIKKKILKNNNMNSKNIKESKKLIK